LCPEIPRVEKMNNEDLYINYFHNLFAKVKEGFIKTTYSKKADELSSGEIAYRDAINSLPCPVSILRITIDTAKYNEAKNSIYHLIKYDFSNLGKFSIKYFGEIELDKIEHYNEIIQGLDLNDKLIAKLRNFQLLAYSDDDPWFLVQIISYNILENLEKYTEDFRHEFMSTFPDKILELFEKKIDYNTKYELKDDPILSLSKLLQKDKAFALFSKVDKNGIINEITIEDVQRYICNIQLIPSVPDDTKQLFNNAKRLFIFGYFEYHFFTISQHYALLAVESALKEKYINLYGKPTRKFMNLKVIINKLVEGNIIPKGEAKMYDLSRELRNSFSHKASITGPASMILKRLAYLINYLFDE